MAFAGAKTTTVSVIVNATSAQIVKGSKQSRATHVCKRGVSTAFSPNST